MAKSIFITATGTEVGKTFVSGLLVKKLKDLDCGYYKPVLSGLDDAGLNDCEYVIKTAQIDAEPMSCVTYAFHPPLSPHLAAKMAGVEISINKIKEDFDRIKQKYNYLVTEGAGGILCPFKLDGEKLLLPDVIKALNLDIIIVAPAGLGSINSAVLTYEYAKQAGITVKGFILNNYEEDNFMHKDNKKCIETLTGVKVLATVKKDDKELNIDKETLAKVFKEI